MTNSNKFPKSAINDVLDFSIENKHSDFYSNIYASNSIKLNPINSYIDFLRLPVIDKDDLLKVDFKDRIFLPQYEIRGYSVTSGTTNNKKVLMLPFSHPSNFFSENIVSKERMEKLGVKGIIFLCSPLHGMTRHLIYSNKNSIPFILSKVDDFKLSVSMIKESGIEGIISTPTIMELYLPYIIEADLTKKIKWICLAGEQCSAQKKKLLKSNFLNATFDFIYGSAETGIIGYQCDHLKKSAPNIYHPVPNLFFEILDDKNKPLNDNSGNIVITSLEKTASPLIRYKNGDMGRFMSQKCKCCNNITFELIGRTGFDSVKTQGVIIHASAVEKALLSVSDEILPDFELHVYEKTINGKVLPKLVLKVIPKSNIIIDKEKILIKLSQKISDNLWLSSKNTLSNLVKQSVFLPLKVEFVETLKTNTDHKPRVIINHIS